MKRYIVITSIFEPTDGVKKFASMSNHSVIVIGDIKTPKGWNYDGIEYFSIESQGRMNYKLAKSVPTNHYSRKMLGYLFAIQNEADLIIDTDDDNVPKENWSFPDFQQEYDCLPDNKGFVNIYKYFTNKKIWPRGLPLQFIKEETNNTTEIFKKECKVGIWQGLVDADPDVDAIYRLTINEPCYFSYRNPIVLGKGTVAPFNTQNTIFRKDLFPLLYLPTYITFRFTDILRGLVAQPIMWQFGFHLGFTSASAIQVRNNHNYMDDFISEIPMYKYSEKVINLVSNSISPNNSIEDNLFCSYMSLHRNNIVKKLEISTLECWLKDLDSLAKHS